MQASRRDSILVALIASTIALVSVRPYAGSWNDGSRLATIESQVDRGTFAIDDSIFVRVPPESPPYDAADLQQTGTLDRLRIDGRYYSDKSPVPAVVLASLYAIIQRVTGLSAADSPHLYCWLMNLLGGGLPFVVAVVAVHRITLHVGLSRRHRWLLTLSFALATVAPAYARYVNNHIMLLAVCTVLTLLMVRAPSLVAPLPRLCGGEGMGVRGIGRVADSMNPPHPHPLSPAKPGERGYRTIPPPMVWLALGALAGFGYTVDLGLGPMLVAAVGGWVLWQCRREWTVSPLALFALAALPWLALHHAINYAIAGTVGPANAKPAYFDWPGCPFDTQTMTGRWQHANIGEFTLYALDLLVGQRGFLGHNLPLYAVLLGLPIILRRCPIERPVVLVSLAWCGLAFLAYAATSNNYSGLCLSIRWFVPMLAPGFLLLTLLVRERPHLARDIALLSAFSFAGAMAGWWRGPWSRPPLALYWSVTAAGLIAWGLFRLREYRRRRAKTEVHHAAPSSRHVPQRLAAELARSGMGHLDS